jgi:hypothetical protein
MTELALPALDGRTPLGFLAALGVLRLVTEHTGYPGRLAFSRQNCTAVLHDAHPDIDSLVADLTTIVRDIPDGGVLPHVSVDFPPPGEAPDKLRLSRPAFTAYAQQVAATDGPGAERWLGVLLTDLSTDDKGRIDIGPYRPVRRPVGQAVHPHDARQAAGRHPEEPGSTARGPPRLAALPRGHRGIP